MSNRKWLDLSAYKLRLFVNLDVSGKGQHKLVFAGRGLKDHVSAFEQLGFVLDARFSNPYWVARVDGVPLAKIAQAFPRAFMRVMPVEEVMPAMAAKAKSLTDKARTDLKRKEGNGPELGNAPSLPRHAHRVGVNAGTDGAAVLGADDPRNHVRSEPRDDG